MLKPIKINELRTIKDHILVTDMNFKERTTTGGIYLLSDDGRSAGVRPRWAQVYAIGEDQQDVKIGQWVLVTHGRWTRGVGIEDKHGEQTIRRIDPNDILLVSDTEPTGDDTQSTAELVDSKSRW
jgi:co-chaperonin GroES (HSP10)